jgi:nucleoside-diphosphate-sugar epimerase
MVGVTGANGYVGSRILEHLRAAGIETVALVRRPAPGETGARRYALGEPPGPGTLEGIDWVVHAAYDLSARGERSRAVNHEGSLPLLDALAQRGGRAILISSLAAFEGARSEYGQTKLALEREALRRGGVVLRAGVVFGTHAGGMFGALVQSVARGADAAGADAAGARGGRVPVPLVGGGWQRLFVTHDKSLCELVEAVLAGHFGAAKPVFAAHEVPTTLREIAAQIAGAQGKRLRAIPLPAAPVYLALRMAELAGLRLSFRSDSVRSLANPIPLDQVAALERSRVVFPALEPSLWAAKSPA